MAMFNWTDTQLKYTARRRAKALADEITYYLQNSSAQLNGRPVRRATIPQLQLFKNGKAKMVIVFENEPVKSDGLDIHDSRHVKLTVTGGAIHSLGWSGEKDLIDILVGYMNE